MSTQVKSWGPGKALAAIISLLIGMAAIGLLAFSISLLFADITFRNPALIPVTGLSVEFFDRVGGVLAGTAGGFLLGLAGVVCGCSCFPENRADMYARLRKWLAGCAIGLGVFAMIFHLLLASSISALSQTFYQ